MARLVEDLLSLSRIEANEHTRPIATVNLGAILEAVCTSLAIEAKRVNMNLLLHVPPDLPNALGDSDQIAQVAQNLIENAIKYGRFDSNVEISAFRQNVLPLTFPKSEAPAIAFSVRDMGDGIHPDDIPRLTERFYWVDPGRSSALGGTGLGLAIVKHIVTRHRGALTIESKLGEGSTFTITLPQKK